MQESFSLVLWILSASLALVVGAIITYLDCYATLTNRVGRVPGAFVKNPLVIGLALLCGVIAAIACYISDVCPKSIVGNVLALNAPDPVRGLVVGASVLILIRSKLLNIKDSPFGGDYIYQLGRDIAIHDVNNKWTIVRMRFQTRNIDIALNDAAFEQNIIQLIRSNIQARPEAFQARVITVISTVTGNRPTIAFSPSAIEWRVYYRALMGVALDACGPNVVKTLPGFT